VKVSSAGPLTPKAPSSSASAYVVVPAGVAAAVPVPVVPCVMLRVSATARPPNSLALTARAATAGWVTVIVSPAPRAVTSWAENT